MSEYFTKTKSEKRLSKKQQRQALLRGAIRPQGALTPKSFFPLTKNQSQVCDLFDSGKSLVLHGSAGTGKTFLALYLMLDEIINYSGDSRQKSVHIIRSTVPSRDMGFLPGSAKEKSRVYETPYIQIASEIFGRGDAYDILKQRKIISFETTSFLRGLTFTDTFLLVDEIQNMTFQEIDTILTRVGPNTRVALVGDTSQCDFTKETSGFHRSLAILENMPKYFSSVQFTTQDIVRSGLVKDYLIQREIFDKKGITQ